MSTNTPSHHCVVRGMINHINLMGFVLWKQSLDRFTVVVNKHVARRYHHVSRASVCTNKQELSHSVFPSDAL